METLTHVVDGFVFRWQANANGYDSFIQVYSRRHWNNCLYNKTTPWAMQEIKVKADNGAYAFGPEVFVQFCEDWLSDPVTWNRLVRNEIQRIDSLDMHEQGHIENTNLPYRVGDHGDTPNLPFPVKGKTEEDEDWNRKMADHIETVKLNDFPYVGYKPRILDV